MSDILTLRNILQHNTTFAIVGLSANWYRPSFFAAKYLQEHGYRIVPVNPAYKEVLGEPCYPDLASIPHPVDVVDCFRKPDELPQLAREAVAIGAKVFWMQLGLRSDEARAIAESAGLSVVEDRCAKIEYARLFGGLNFAGVNTRVISARRPLWVPR